jgi:hypothetical protein
MELLEDSVVVQRDVTYPALSSSLSSCCACPTLPIELISRFQDSIVAASGVRLRDSIIIIDVVHTMPSARSHQSPDVGSVCMMNQKMRCRVPMRHSSLIGLPTCYWYQVAYYWYTGSLEQHDVSIFIVTAFWTTSPEQFYLLKIGW